MKLNFLFDGSSTARLICPCCKAHLTTDLSALISIQSTIDLLIQRLVNRKVSRGALEVV